MDEKLKQGKMQMKMNGQNGLRRDSGTERERK